MNRSPRMFLACTLMALACGNASPPGIRVESAWVRPSNPPHRSTPAYMVIRNNAGKPCSLIGATSDASGTVELQVMEHDGKTLRLRRVAAIPIPEGGITAFQPGGNRLILISLHRNLAPGDTIGITLLFETGKQTVRAPVMSLQDFPNGRP